MPVFSNLCPSTTNFTRPIDGWTFRCTKVCAGGVCKHFIYIRMNNLNILELKLIILLFHSDDLYETGLLYNQRFHRLTAQMPGVPFWDSDNIMTRPALFSVDDLHPSHEYNAVLHSATASRLLQLLSPDSRRGFVT